MPARKALHDREPDLPEQDRRDGRFDEIQALLESPELRRIFDEEPARIRSRTRRRESAEQTGSSPKHRGARSDEARRGRKRRILIGLAPVYVGVVILASETVREPSMLLQAFGAQSAEETPARAGAAIIGATAPQDGPKVELRDDAALRESDESSTSVAAPAPAPDQTDPKPIATKVAMADVRQGAETRQSPVAGKSVVTEKVAMEKAALDLAKRAPAGPPAEAAVEAPPVVLASSPAAADLPSPAPRASAVAVTETIDAAAAEAAEDALALSRSGRRDIQRRLRFASADPEAIDGIFGPATRSAIAAWQEAAGLPATGYMDEPAMALLAEQTDDEYRAWQESEHARAREREAESAAVATSAVPKPRYARPREEDACRRTASGEIAFGKDAGCNFQAFGENFKRDFKNLKGELRSLFD